MKRDLMKKISRFTLKLNVLLGTALLSMYAWADSDDPGPGDLGQAAQHMKTEADNVKTFALGAGQIFGIGLGISGMMDIYHASKGSPNHKMVSGIVKFTAGAVLYFLPRFLGMAASSILPTGG